MNNERLNDIEKRLIEREEPSYWKGDIYFLIDYCRKLERIIYGDLENEV